MDRALLRQIRDDVIAIVPARSGSKSVPQKNIRNFMGHPLIAYSIAVAKLSKEISRVIVSTDSEKYAEISRRYGAETPFLRPVEFARDSSPDIEFVQHAITWMSENEGTIPRFIVHLRPTTPIRDYRIVDEAVWTIRQDTFATSLRSGCCCSSPPYKWFQELPKNKYLVPLMPGISIEETNNARQNFPKVFVPNGYVDVLKTECVILTDTIHGENMMGYWTEEVPDIDTELDIKLLECYPGMKDTLKELWNTLSAYGCQTQEDFA